MHRWPFELVFAVLRHPFRLTCPSGAAGSMDSATAPRRWRWPLGHPIPPMGLLLAPNIIFNDFNSFSFFFNSSFCSVLFGSGFVRFCSVLSNLNYLQYVLQII